MCVLINKATSHRYTVAIRNEDTTPTKNGKHFLRRRFFFAKLREEKHYVTGFFSEDQVSKGFFVESSRRGWAALGFTLSLKCALLSDQTKIFCVETWWKCFFFLRSFSTCVFLRHGETTLIRCPIFSFFFFQTQPNVKTRRWRSLSILE